LNGQLLLHSRESCASDIFLPKHDTSPSFPYPDWAVFHQHVQWMFITGLSVGVAVDFLIAAAISYYLVKGRKNGIQSYVSLDSYCSENAKHISSSTQNIVNILLWYTIDTTAILT
jgi:hypothetical protein